MGCPAAAASSGKGRRAPSPGDAATRSAAVLKEGVLVPLATVVVGRRSGFDLVGEDVGGGPPEQRSWSSSSSCSWMEAKVVVASEQAIRRR